MKIARLQVARTRCIATVASVMFAAACLAQSPAPSKVEIDSWVQAYYAKDYTTALTQLKAEIARSPRVRPTAHDHYNLACIHARMSETDPSHKPQAEASLLEAIQSGFSDFHRLIADPSLTSLADSQARAAIDQGWRELQDAIADDRINSWAAMLTSSSKVQSLDDASKAFALKGYRLQRFTDLRVNLISGFSEKATAEVETSLRAMLALWHATLKVPGDGLDTPNIARPDPWVTIILLKADDFESWQRVQQQGRTGNIGGIYSSRRQELVSRDLGPTLRHEFWHALHHRNMSRLNQDHPVWIQEGLCSLPETIEEATKTATAKEGSKPQPERDDPATTQPPARGVLRFAPNFRTSMAKKMLANRILLPLDRLLALDDNRFTSSQVLGNYAHARSLMHWLHDQGLLATWYARYTERYREDRTGKLALQEVLKLDLPSADKAFRQWLQAQPDGADAPISGRLRAWLPVELTAAAGEGVQVAPWPEGTDLGTHMRTPLGPGDVIVAINGTRVHDVGEISQVLHSFSPGDQIECTIRQGAKGQERNVKVRLIEAE